MTLDGYGLTQDPISGNVYLSGGSVIYVIPHADTLPVNANYNPSAYVTPSCGFVDGLSVDGAGNIYAAGLSCNDVEIYAGASAATPGAQLAVIPVTSPDGIAVSGTVDATDMLRRCSAVIVIRWVCVCVSVCVCVCVCVCVSLSLSLSVTVCVHPQRIRASSSWAKPAKLQSRR